MAKVWEVESSEDPFNFCCGIIEVGSFDAWSDDKQDWEESITQKQAWTNELQKIRNNSKNYPLVMTFAKHRERKTFDNNVLRLLVKTQPDCLFVHKWKNPNSGNTVECYVLTNGSK